MDWERLERGKKKSKNCRKPIGYQEVANEKRGKEQVIIEKGRRAKKVGWKESWGAKNERVDQNWRSHKIGVDQSCGF